MSIQIIDLDKKERLEKEIAELQQKIATYPMPTPPPKLEEALAAKEAELRQMYQ